MKTAAQLHGATFSVEPGGLTDDPPRQKRKEATMRRKHKTKIDENLEEICSCPVRDCQIQLIVCARDQERNRRACERSNDGYGCEHLDNSKGKAQLEAYRAEKATITPSELLEQSEKCGKDSRAADDKAKADLIQNTPAGAVEISGPLFGSPEQPSLF